MRVRHQGQRPTARTPIRTLVRLAVLAAAAGVLVAAGTGPAHADHLPTDIFAHFDDITDSAITGGLATFDVHAGVDSDPVDFTGAVTLTLPTPPGTTFYDVSGTLPLAVGGAPGGPPCATPARGGTGTVVCTGAFGPEGSPAQEAHIFVRFRVNPDVAEGDLLETTVSGFVAGNPVPFDSDTDGFEVAAGRAIVSTGPTDEITMTPDLNCQAHHTGDALHSFYPEGEGIGSCSTALLVQSTDTVYVPDVEGPSGDDTFTPVSQALSGTGTAADPYKIVTVVDAGTSGIRLIQTDSYVVGQPQWRTDVQIVNSTGTPQNVRLYRLGDCYLGGSDRGYGQVGPQPGAVACLSATGRLLQWVPITPGSHYAEGDYRTVQGFVPRHQPFPDTCDCAILKDNAAGLSWDVTVPAFGSVTISQTTGILVTSVSKTADQATVAAGGTDGYTITVSNYAGAPVTLSTITDTLPTGFTYQPGSTTGATTANPAVAGGTLTWTGAFTVPAGTASAPGSASLHFGVAVSTTPGLYLNEAGATSQGGTVEVTPSGPTAGITVLGTQTITFTSTAPTNPPVGSTYTVTATGGASGNPVTFTSATPSTCTVSGSTVSFIAPGTCTINANQAGNANYNPAPQVTQTMTVVKASPTIATVASAGGPVGSTPVRDVATLSGGAGPTGSVVFKLFSDSGCATQKFTSTNNLSGTSATSAPDFTPITVGTFYWTAVYGGDAKNNAATSPCQAANESVTIVKATPTISTVASPGNLVGAPVRDTATVAGGFGPTGTVTFKLFSDANCTTQVSTSTNPLGTPSDWFTPATAGTYRWTATYNGDANNNSVSGACNAPNESVTLAPFTAPTYTRTIEGDLQGPVTVTSGESVLIKPGARVVGPVTVAPGGALTVQNAQISRGIVVDNPRFLSICGSDVSAPSPATALSVSNAAVPIRIGDPANGCAANRFAGQVTLTANLATTFGTNTVSGAATVTNGGPGLTVIKANTVLGTLACSGNTPAPTNAGQTNTAGAKTGQCAGL